MKLKKEIFNIFYEFDQEITYDLITRVLILFNKYYPSYLITHSDWNSIQGDISWEDFVIGDYILTSKYDFSIDMKVPLYIEKDGVINFLYIDKSIKIYYGLEETTNRNSFGINFYGNVYTDIRYDWDNEKKVDVAIDQSISAKKNREIMTAFLKELEILLEADITEFLSPYYLDEKHIYKYGIKDEAVLNYGQNK